MGITYIGMYLNDITYETGSFVIIPLTDAYCVFLIERVESSKENFEEIGSSLKVDWLQAKEGIYDSTYSFAYVSEAKQVRSL